MIFAVTVFAVIVTSVTAAVYLLLLLYPNGISITIKLKKKLNNEYQCPYCSQTSTRKYNIQVHIERKHPYSKQTNLK